MFVNEIEIPAPSSQKAARVSRLNSRWQPAFQFNQQFSYFFGGNAVVECNCAGKRGRCGVPVVLSFYQRRCKEIAECFVGFCRSIAAKRTWDFSGRGPGMVGPAPKHFCIWVGLVQSQQSLLFCSSDPVLLLKFQLDDSFAHTGKILRSSESFAGFCRV